jgi:endophilin-A
VKGISKLSGQAKAATYPQPEGVLGDCMVTYGKKLGDDSLFGKSLGMATHVLPSKIGL